MAERVEQMFWVHNRGLIIALPPIATEKIAAAVEGGQPLPREESQRLSIILNDSILRDRHPNPEAGLEYMSQVDISWRENLYTQAEEITEQIKEESFSMGKEDIAIILFGSVAKALSRSQDHPDPSNIDLAIIGQFSQEERDELFDRIRPYRVRGSERIGSNIGVFIQCPDKLIKAGYGQALGYIGSSATALYDPTGIWADIEKDAIDVSFGLKRFNHRNGYGNGHGIAELTKITPRLETNKVLIPVG